MDGSDGGPIGEIRQKSAWKETNGGRKTNSASVLSHPIIYSGMKIPWRAKYPRRQLPRVRSISHNESLLRFHKRASERERKMRNEIPTRWATSRAHQHDDEYQKKTHNRRSKRRSFHDAGTEKRRSSPNKRATEHAQWPGASSEASSFARPVMMYSASYLGRCVQSTGKRAPRAMKPFLSSLSTPFGARLNDAARSKRASLFSVMLLLYFIVPSAAADARHSSRRDSAGMQRKLPSTDFTRN